MTGLSRKDILDALEALAVALGREGQRSELFLVGGAALVLLYGARESTKDVDAFASTASTQAVLRRAASRVAEELGLPDDWLNDAAKGYVQGLTMGPIVLDRPSLVVRAVAPQQLLAMKLSAWRVEGTLRLR